MKSPSEAELQLWRELVAERDDLSELIQETYYTIGQVARKGYSGLHKLPAQRDPLLRQPGFQTLLFRIKPLTCVRDAVMPDSPIPVPGNTTYVVAETSTVTHKRMYLPRRMPFGLPGGQKGVRIQLHNPDEQPYTDSLFQIGTRGSVSFGNQFRDTAPLLTVGNPRSPVYRSDKKYYYSSPEHMRDDYASSYSGALAVAGLVAASLEAVHGIESDTTSISPLLGAWRNVAVTDRDTISPRLVEFLPRDLAEQAGARLE
jgi:hypothetical protein